jgi:hypothetical protein
MGLSGAGAAIMGGSGMLGQNFLPERVTLNLEDVVLHEQKLANILEVSYKLYKQEY